MRKKAPSRPRSGNYEIGKGRPPQQTRWQPGQSGNPKGRPKGAKSLLVFIHEQLERKIQIEERGKTRWITLREAIGRQFVNQAVKGDLKVLSLLLAKEPEIARQALPVPKITMDMSPEEASKVYFKIVRQIR